MHVPASLLVLLGTTLLKVSIADSSPAEVPTFEEFEVPQPMGASPLQDHFPSDKLQALDEARFINFLDRSTDKNDAFEGALEASLSDLGQLVQAEVLEPETLRDSIFSTFRTVLGHLIRASLVGRCFPGTLLYQFFGEVAEALRNHSCEPLQKELLCGLAYLCFKIQVALGLAIGPTAIPVIGLLDDTKREQLLLIVPDFVVALMSQGWYSYPMLKSLSEIPDRQDALLEQFKQFLTDLNNDHQALDLAEWLLFTVYSIERDRSHWSTPSTKLTTGLSEVVFNLAKKLTGVSLKENVSYPVNIFTLNRSALNISSKPTHYNISQLMEVPFGSDENAMFQSYVEWFSEGLEQLESFIKVIKLFNKEGRFRLDASTAFWPWDVFLNLGEWLLNVGNACDGHEKYIQLFKRAQDFFIEHQERFGLSFKVPKARSFPEGLRALLPIIDQYEGEEEEEEEA